MRLSQVVYGHITDAGVTLSELVDRTGLTRTEVSDALSTLRRGGWIERHPPIDPHCAKPLGVWRLTDKRPKPKAVLDVPLAPFARPYTSVWDYAGRV